MTGPEDGTGRTDRPHLLRAGMSVSGLSLDELWAAALGLGDGLTRTELQAALAGEIVLDDHRYDVVAQALNDRLVELHLDHLVPTARETGSAP